MLREELNKSVAYIVDNEGYSAIVVRRGSGTYDVSTGSRPRPPTPEAVRIVTVAYKREDVNGVSIVVGDKKVYVQAATPLVVGDEIHASDGEWKIVDIHDVFRGPSEGVYQVLQVRT